MVSRVTGHGESPLDITHERYASGELTREEFQRVREDFTRSV